MWFGRRRAENKKDEVTNGTHSLDMDHFLREKIEVKDLEYFPTDQDQLSNKLNKIFADCDDFVQRNITLPSGQNVTLLYFTAMVNEDLLQSGVIDPLVKRNIDKNKEELYRLEDQIFNLHINHPLDWKSLINDSLKGDVICHISGQSPVLLSLSTKEKRNLSDPTTEYQIYGPKIGFIEDSRTNVSILRRFIRDPRLKVKEFQLGSLSHTHVALLYLEEYVDPELLNIVKDRLHNIKEDNIVSSGQLANLIIDHPMSIFPQINKTERPDNASYALSQGKVVICLDNSTFVLILPSPQMRFFETSEDNFQQVWNMTFVRLLRFISLVSAAVLPALYVALVAFHPELLPTTLALTIAESRNNIPFPAAAEALIMMFALDVLVEASIRLPLFVGQTVAIVGGLVIGQAAVEAGIVSSTMIIVIAFTAIASFTTPSWEVASAWRLVRYFLVILAANLGLFGLSLGVALVMIHLAHLQSFARPYLSPFGPFNPREFLNILIKFLPKKTDQV